MEESHRVREVGRKRGVGWTGDFPRITLATEVDEDDAQGPNVVLLWGVGGRRMGVEIVAFWNFFLKKKAKKKGKTKHEGREMIGSEYKIVNQL